MVGDREGDGARWRMGGWWGYSEGLTLRKCSINKAINICCAKMLCKRALHNIWSVFTQHMLSDLMYKCWVGLDQHPVPIRTTYVVRNWFSLNICCAKRLIQTIGTTYWSTSPNISYHVLNVVQTHDVVPKCWSRWLEQPFAQHMLCQNVVQSGLHNIFTQHMLIGFWINMMLIAS